MIEKTKYNIEQLESASDDKLLELLYDKACELHFETFGQNFKIASLTFKELFATMILDAEVKNGGFDQFFDNNNIEWAKYAMNGFKKIGAIELEELVESAMEIFINQSKEYANKRNPDFDNLDEILYDFENLEKLQLKYIRSNYAEFTVPD